MWLITMGSRVLSAMGDTPLCSKPVSSSAVARVQSRVAQGGCGRADEGSGGEHGGQRWPNEPAHVAATHTPAAHLTPPRAPAACCTT